MPTSARTTGGHHPPRRAADRYQAPVAATPHREPPPTVTTTTLTGEQPLIGVMATSMERANQIIQDLHLPNAFGMTASIERTAGSRANAVIVESALKPLAADLKEKLLADLAKTGGNLFILHEIHSGSTL